MSSQIKIAQRYLPFTHSLKTKCLVPRTSESVTIFPTRIIFKEKEIDLPLTGPFSNFMVQSDFERGKLTVSGKSTEGFFRFEIYAKESQIVFDPVKLKMEKVEIPVSCVQLPVTKERIAFGCHKKQDIEGIIKRDDLREILPFWHRLALIHPQKKDGDAPLIEEAKGLLLENKKEEALSSIRCAFQSGFSSLFHPEKVDPFHQNLSQEQDASALILDGANCIRDFFFQEKGDDLYLLPHLPKDFVFGKMTDISLKFGTFDIEWSKGQIRRAIFKVQKRTQVRLVLQPGIKSFRVNKVRRMHSGDTLSLDVGTVLLDRYES